ncbi:uncharacterized protein LOC130669830 isoform X2 [Microplitis mediator]|uniref:uncharacterized protein LOC130669830 isoform X2 n=1 Tax=Microplitis mediator TaxID=375433 RepID=UPI0025536A77|nr:uncharacterized protein LOC130669830 isoform X2 [Microplitis mediator]
MEFPPKKTKNKTVCCVYGCKSKACRDDTVRFYTFPTANTDFVKVKNEFGEEELIDRREAWIKVLKMGNYISNSMRVCSRHFTKSDYIPHYNNNKSRCHLKKISVPSCNLPERSSLLLLNTKPSGNNSKESDSCLQRPRTNDVTCLDDSLMSLEKLDRASPELWPEQIPGVNEFIAQNLSTSEQSSWSASGVSSEDMTQLHQLGNLPMTSLIAEVKKLHDLAYQLGLEEAKEMTRGKYLNIFKNKEK